MTSFESDAFHSQNPVDWDQAFQMELQPIQTDTSNPEVIAEPDRSRVIYEPHKGSSAADEIRSLSGHRYTYKFGRQETSACKPLPKNFRLETINNIIKLIEDPDL